MFKQLATHELACSRSHSRICSFLLLQQQDSTGGGRALAFLAKLKSLLFPQMTESHGGSQERR